MSASSALRHHARTARPSGTEFLSTQSGLVDLRLIVERVDALEAKLDISNVVRSKIHDSRDNAVEKRFSELLIKSSNHMMNELKKMKSKYDKISTQLENLQKDSQGQSAVMEATAVRSQEALKSSTAMNELLADVEVQFSSDIQDLRNRIPAEIEKGHLKEADERSHLNMAIADERNRRASAFTELENITRKQSGEIVIVDAHVEKAKEALDKRLLAEATLREKAIQSMNQSVDSVRTEMASFATRQTSRVEQMFAGAEKQLSEQIAGKQAVLENRTAELESDVLPRVQRLTENALSQEKAREKLSEHVDSRFAHESERREKFEEALESHVEMKNHAIREELRNVQTITDSRIVEGAEALQKLDDKVTFTMHSLGVEIKQGLKEHKEAVAKEMAAMHRTQAEQQIKREKSIEHAVEKMRSEVAEHRTFSSEAISALKLAFTELVHGNTQLESKISAGNEEARNRVTEKMFEIQKGHARFEEEALQREQALKESVKKLSDQCASDIKQHEAQLIQQTSDLESKMLARLAPICEVQDAMNSIKTEQTQAGTQISQVRASLEAKITENDSNQMVIIQKQESERQALSAELRRLMDGQNGKHQSSVAELRREIEKVSEEVKYSEEKLISHVSEKSQDILSKATEADSENDASLRAEMERIRSKIADVAKENEAASRKLAEHTEKVAQSVEDLGAFAARQRTVVVEECKSYASGQDAAAGKQVKALGETLRSELAASASSLGGQLKTLFGDVAELSKKTSGVTQEVTELLESQSSCLAQQVVAAEEKCGSVAANAVGCVERVRLEMVKEQRDLLSEANEERGELKEKIALLQTEVGVKDVQRQNDLDLMLKKYETVSQTSKRACSSHNALEKKLVLVEADIKSELRGKIDQVLHSVSRSQEQEESVVQEVRRELEQLTKEVLALRKNVVSGLEAKATKIQELELLHSTLQQGANALQERVQGLSSRTEDLQNSQTKTDEAVARAAAAAHADVVSSGEDIVARLRSDAKRESDRLATAIKNTAETARGERETLRAAINQVKHAQETETESHTTALESVEKLVAAQKETAAAASASLAADILGSSRRVDGLEQAVQKDIAGCVASVSETRATLLQHISFVEKQQGEDLGTVNNSISRLRGLATAQIEENAAALKKVKDENAASLAQVREELDLKAAEDVEQESSKNEAAQQAMAGELVAVTDKLVTELHHVKSSLATQIENVQLDAENQTKALEMKDSELDGEIEKCRNLFAKHESNTLSRLEQVKQVAAAQLKDTESSLATVRQDIASGQQAARGIVTRLNSVASRIEEGLATVEQDMKTIEERRIESTKRLQEAQEVSLAASKATTESYATNVDKLCDELKTIVKENETRNAEIIDTETQRSHKAFRVLTKHTDTRLVSLKQQVEEVRASVSAVVDSHEGIQEKVKSNDEKSSELFMQQQMAEASLEGVKAELATHENDLSNVRAGILGLSKNVDAKVDILGSELRNAHKLTTASIEGELEGLRKDFDQSVKDLVQRDDDLGQRIHASDQLLTQQLEKQKVDALAQISSLHEDLNTRASELEGGMAARASAAHGLVTSAESRLAVALSSLEGKLDSEVRKAVEGRGALNKSCLDLSGRLLSLSENATKGRTEILALIEKLQVDQQVSSQDVAENCGLKIGEVRTELRCNEDASAIAFDKLKQTNRQEIESAVEGVKSLIKDERERAEELISAVSSEVEQTKSDATELKVDLAKEMTQMEDSSHLVQTKQWSEVQGLAGKYKDLGLQLVEIENSLGERMQDIYARVSAVVETHNQANSKHAEKVEAVFQKITEDKETSAALLLKQARSIVQQQLATVGKETEKKFAQVVSEAETLRAEIIALRNVWHVHKQGTAELLKDSDTKTRAHLEETIALVNAKYQTLSEVQKHNVVQASEQLRNVSSTLQRLANDTRVSMEEKVTVQGAKFSATTKDVLDTMQGSVASLIQAITDTGSSADSSISQLGSQLRSEIVALQNQVTAESESRETIAVQLADKIALFDQSLLECQKSIAAAEQDALERMSGLRNEVEVLAGEQGAGLERVGATLQGLVQTGIEKNSEVVAQQARKASEDLKLVKTALARDIETRFHTAQQSANKAAETIGGLKQDMTKEFGELAAAVEASRNESKASVDSAKELATQIKAATVKQVESLGRETQQLLKSHSHRTGTVVADLRSHVSHMLTDAQRDAETRFRVAEQALSAETQNRNAAEKEMGTKLDQETNERRRADTLLIERLNGTITPLKEEVDGAVADLRSRLHDYTRSANDLQEQIAAKTEAVQNTVSGLVAKYEDFENVAAAKAEQSHIKSVAACGEGLAELSGRISVLAADIKNIKTSSEDKIKQVNELVVKGEEKAGRMSSRILKQLAERTLETNDMQVSVDSQTRTLSEKLDTLRDRFDRSRQSMHDVEEGTMVSIREVGKDIGRLSDTVLSVKEGHKVLSSVVDSRLWDMRQEFKLLEMRLSLSLENVLSVPLHSKSRADLALGGAATRRGGDAKSPAAMPEGGAASDEAAAAGTDDGPLTAPELEGPGTPKPSQHTPVPMRTPVAPLSNAAVKAQLSRSRDLGWYKPDDPDDAIDVAVCQVLAALPVPTRIYLPRLAQGVYMADRKINVLVFDGNVVVKISNSEVEPLKNYLMRIFLESDENVEVEGIAPPPAPRSATQTQGPNAGRRSHVRVTPRLAQSQTRRR